MTVETIVATSDAFVWNGDPSTNYGDSTSLKVQLGDRYAYIHFTMPFEQGDTIVSAYLRLWLRSAWDTGGPFNFTVRRITESWKESKINWDNKPTTDGTASATLVVPNSPQGTMIEFDVTSLIQGMSDGASYHGLRIACDNGTVRSLYSSDDVVDPTRHPQLEVTWVQDPTQPTSLLPDGGRVVSLDKPTLSWVYAGKGGDFQSAVQVQISTSSVFASVEFDTGWLTTTMHQLDLETTAYAGVPNGGTRYWRVRAKDALGNISEWSETAEFSRSTKGVVTITNPSGAITDTSPVITHTFVGQTQASIQYLISRVDEGEKLVTVYDSKQFASTATSFSTPENVITKPGATYRYQVRVWDELDRVETQGDPAYAEDLSDVTYSSSGGPDPIEDLDLTSSTELPWADFLWTRTNRPDWFAIKVDGEYIETRLDPADLETTPGGDSYLYRIWNLRPLVEHTVEVEAVEFSGGIYSNSIANPIVTFTLSPKNRWLVCPDLDLKVAVISQEPVESSIGENGSTFFPVGRREPVRIIDSIRGYEGSVAGGITDYKGTTMQDYKKNLEAIKGLGPETGLRLIWYDMNIPISIGEVVLTSTRDPWYLVQFSFWQNGEFTFDAL